MRKRLFFEKTGDMKYISHLDLIRFLERLFKKSEINIKFTEGFHPRPKMSFGNPISLGVEAFNEPMDIELLEDISNEKIIESINQHAPIGFKINGAENIEKFSIAKDYNGIKYSLEFENKDDLNMFIDLLNKEEIIEERKKNGKIKRRDLKEKVHSFNIEDNIISLILLGMSPNALLKINDYDMSTIKIKRLDYLNI